MYKPEEVMCDVCGRNMETKKGVSIIGMHITLEASTEKEVKETQAIYPEIELGKAYKVCWACWLKSLGIKLNKKL